MTPARVALPPPFERSRAAAFFLGARLLMTDAFGLFFTRERSKVRSLVRPPLGLNNQRLNELLPRGGAPEKLGHNGGTAFGRLQVAPHSANRHPPRLRAQPTRCCGYPQILCLNRRHDRSYALGVRRLTLPGCKVWMAASSREPSRWNRPHHV